jgi:hypothetical protein
MTRVFVSHSNRDREWVQQHVVDPLRAAGHQPFFSDDDIAIGEDWGERIEKELSGAEALVVVVSPRVLAHRRWVRAEVNWWTENRADDKLIPIVVDGCKPSQLHLLLDAFQYVDFSDPAVWPQRTIALVTALGIVAETPKPTLERPHNLSRLPVSDDVNEAFSNLTVYCS